MIRLRKDSNVPDSLLKDNCNSYSEEDVQKQIDIDHDGKCYICEKIVNNDFQIEHLKPKNKYLELKYEWTNLLLACPFCNQRKSSGFDDILNPLDENIECIVSHGVDFVNGKIDLSSDRNDAATLNTINLIERLFNGKAGLRKLKEEKLYQYFAIHIRLFLRVVNKFIVDSSDVNKNLVIDYLKIDKEFLAFKYYIIVCSDNLFDVFHDYIVWNKQDV